MRIAYLTAGAAGMYCGSCLHDNTLARELSRLGADVQLLPTYTPIRTDEESVSGSRVFFGGVNVYLDQNVPLYRWLPTWVTSWLNRPRVINYLAGSATQIDAKQLGALTVSMLRGEAGKQRREVQELCRYLRDEAKPDLVVLTNMLIGGCIPAIRREVGIPVLVTLQGDDIFLDSLPPSFRQQAIDEIQRLSQDVSGFLVHSNYYGQHMADSLRLPLEKMHRVPLGIDAHDFLPAAHDPNLPPTIGYLARLAPEKGLHVLVDAFIDLRRRREMSDTRLAIAGWLGPQNKAYADEQFQKLRGAGLADAFRYWGEVDRAGKIAFLQSLIVLSVPTVYREPKGLFVLEALASGVPVVQPNHGAFPELLAATGGGRLVPPENSHQLAETLATMIGDRASLAALGGQGRETVLRECSGPAMAAKTLTVFRKFAGASTA